MSSSRRETDFLGNVDVPIEALYGSFTTRAINNFSVSGLAIHPLFIESLAQVKKAAAETNHELGLLDKRSLNAIQTALDEIVNCEHLEMFPLDVFQAGAGTPWNMNMNEVVANRANQILGGKLGEYDPIHPNDHVNMSQSSNDVIPTAIRLTALKLIAGLIESMNTLQSSLLNKAESFKELRKTARTHTMDAVIITLGAEFHAYASAVSKHIQRIAKAATTMETIPMGGTAVGTGINTPEGYDSLVASNISAHTGLPIKTAKDKVEKTQFASDFLFVMDALSAFTLDIVKMNTDLMLMSSGPRTGLSEIILPEVEPGSSIMPGKVNPSILEMVNMVCFQVHGSRLTVEKAVQDGMFDLNVYTPVIAFNIFNSIQWLTRAVNTLEEKCIRGILANKRVLEANYLNSNAHATLLSPIIGYDEASRLTIKSLKTGKPVIELVVEEGLLTDEEIKRILEEDR